jgi:hypothetical protein
LPGIASVRPSGPSGRGERPRGLPDPPDGSPGPGEQKEGGPDGKYMGGQTEYAYYMRMPGAMEYGGIRGLLLYSTCNWAVSVTKALDLDPPRTSVLHQEEDPPNQSRGRPRPGVSRYPAPAAEHAAVVRLQPTQISRPGSRAPDHIGTQQQYTVSVQTPAARAVCVCGVCGRCRQ